LLGVSRNGAENRRDDTVQQAPLIEE
jgi:hypothetical protein